MGHEQVGDVEVARGLGGQAGVLGCAETGRESAETGGEREGVVCGLVLGDATGVVLVRVPGGLKIEVRWYRGPR